MLELSERHCSCFWDPTRFKRSAMQEAMEHISLTNVLFVLHALAILAKAPLEHAFRALHSPRRAASAEDNELVDRKGARNIFFPCV